MIGSSSVWDTSSSVIASLAWIPWNSFAKAVLGSPASLAMSRPATPPRPGASQRRRAGPAPGSLILRSAARRSLFADRQLPIAWAPLLTLATPRGRRKTHPPPPSRHQMGLAGNLSDTPAITLIVPLLRFPQAAMILSSLGTAFFAQPNDFLSFAKIPSPNCHVQGGRSAISQPLT